MTCPPCNHNCNEGRDCPAKPVPRGQTYTDIHLAYTRDRQIDLPCRTSQLALGFGRSPSIPAAKRAGWWWSALKGSTTRNEVTSGCVHTYTCI